VLKYGKIVVPLATLLKKKSFIWNDATKQYFQDLKEATSTTLVLAIHAFNINFILEFDTSNKGIGEILMQEGCSLALTSKQLCGKNLGKSTYEKEVMDILHVIDILYP